MRRTWLPVMVAAGIALGVALPASASSSAGSKTAIPMVRVNQVGYPTGGPKVAYAMLAGPVGKVSFEVTTPYGVVTSNFTERTGLASIT